MVLSAAVRRTLSRTVTQLRCATSTAHSSPAPATASPATATPSPPLFPHPAPSLLDTLTARGLLAAHSGDRAALELTLAQRPAVYCGFDPTAPALHLGNLVALLALAHARQHGHPAVALVGGATARIGDPSGRASERPALTADTAAENLTGLRGTLQRVLDHAAKGPLGLTESRTPVGDTANAGFTPVADAVAADNVSQLRAKEERDDDGSVLGALHVLDNAAWYAGMSALDFVCGLGRHFRLQGMLARDSVRSRLESAEGLSFTEFAYQMFQAYDFYHLYTAYGCRVQLGGSDQWGNITAGTDLIRRMLRSGEATAAPTHSATSEGERSESAITHAAESAESAAVSTDCHGEAYAVTLPLLTTKSGAKYGKSAGNAIWLCPTLTSPYELYQFLLQTADDEVGLRLRQLTLLPLSAIADLEAVHAAAPERRAAQHALAREVVFLAHGEAGVREAKLCTEVLHGSGAACSTLSAADLTAVYGKVPSVDVPQVQEKTPTVADLLVQAQLASSKKRAKQLVADGGVALNDQVEANPLRPIDVNTDILHGAFSVVRVGRKRMALLRWVPSAA